MAKTVRDAKLDNRTQREKLKARGKPYFRAIDDGLHVGYRKGATGGKWVARRYLGGEKYVVETIGTADDVQDADGKAILNFNQAQAKARKIAQHMRGAASTGPFTVNVALDEYLARLEAEHSKEPGRRQKSHRQPDLPQTGPDVCAGSASRRHHEVEKRHCQTAAPRARQGRQARAAAFRSADG